MIGGIVGGFVAIVNPLGSKEFGLFAGALAQSAIASAENIAAQILGNIVRHFQGQRTFLFDPY
ncbi:hypothetical protein [Nitrospina sp.]|uniref:hypothetical protein n=1 Tax=Nitrospina sp. TaxID=2024844 RepID=UPI003FCE8290